MTGFVYEETQPKARPGQQKEKGAVPFERRFTITFAASDFSGSKDLFAMSNEERITEVVRRLSRRAAFNQDLIAVSALSWIMTDDYAKAPWGVKAITFPVTFMLRSPPQPEAPKPPLAEKKGA